MISRLRRRSFLQGLLCCVTTVPALASVGCGDGSTPTPPVADTRVGTGTRQGRVLAEYFDEGDLDGALVVGQRYLHAVAPNASASDVEALIAPTVERLVSAESDEAALASVRAQILEDFAQGATVLVDGWTFSVTEAQVCVLLSTLVD